MKLANKIAIAAIVPLVGAVVAPIASIVPNRRTSEAHIVDFNDFHGAAVGYGDGEYLTSPSGTQPGIVRMAKAINDIVSAHPGTLVLSAGDNNSGDAFSTCTHGETLYPLLKSMNVRYSAVGNHAFEWGLDYMSEKKFDQWARPDDLPTDENYFVTSNILNGSEYQGTDVTYDVWKEKRVKWADPYKVVDINGHSIALIGLTTKLTKTDGNPTAIQDLSFINYNASINYTKQFMVEEIGKEKYQQIEAFVLLTHVSSSFDGGVYSDEAFDLARNELTTRVDGIISAHSHKEGIGVVHNKNTGQDIIVGQAGTAGHALLDTKFTFDDTRNIGSRLTSIKMSLTHPYIDTAGIDVTRNDLTEVQKTKALVAAHTQYNNLIDYSQTLPTDNMYRKAVDEYLTQRTKVINKLQSPAGNYAHTETDLSYNARSLVKLGHEFYSAKTIVEPMGSWINKAAILGTELLKYENAPKPAIAFINQDSVTHNIDANEDVTIFDMYQLQTYENTLYQGALTVGQLVNIIEYILSGGLQGGGKDNSSAFIYGVNNREYDLINAVETDPLVQGSSIPLPVKKDSNGKETKIRYLCGPLQFHGFKFEIEKLDTPIYTKDWKNIRQYNLAWSDGLPKIWIYDPETDTKHENIDKPENWKPVTYDDTGWNQNRYIPIVINSFTYNGSNFQCSMFKPYMEYNQNKSPSDITKIHNYPALFTRDALLKYCSAFNPTDYSCTFSIPADLVNNIVVYPTQKQK